MRAGAAVAYLMKRFGDICEKDVKFLYQKAKGHDRDAGPNPG